MGVRGGVGEEPMARSWADSWSIWDPNLRKLDNLDTRGFRMLSWSKGSPRVKVRVKVAAVFNTGSKVLVLLSGCKPARKHLRVLCSQARGWRGKITETHQCACGPREQSLSPRSASGLQSSLPLGMARPPLLLEPGWCDGAPRPCTQDRHVPPSMNADL